MRLWNRNRYTYAGRTIFTLWFVLCSMLPLMIVGYVPGVCWEFFHDKTFICSWVVPDVSSNVFSISLVLRIPIGSLSLSRSSGLLGIYAFLYIFFFPVRNEGLWQMTRHINFLLYTEILILELHLKKESEWGWNVISCVKTIMERECWHPNSKVYRKSKHKYVK